MSSSIKTRTLLSRAGLTAGLVVLAVAVLGGVAVEAQGGPGSGEDSARSREFPDAWYYLDRRTGKPYARPASLEGRLAPALSLRDWIGDPVELVAQDQDDGAGEPAKCRRSLHGDLLPEHVTPTSSAACDSRAAREVGRAARPTTA